MDNANTLTDMAKVSLNKALLAENQNIPCTLMQGQNTLLDLCSDIHHTQQQLHDHCLALDQRVHQLAQQMDNWPDQLASALQTVLQQQQQHQLQQLQQQVQRQRNQRADDSLTGRIAQITAQQLLLSGAGVGGVVGSFPGQSMMPTGTVYPTAYSHLDSATAAAATAAAVAAGRKNSLLAPAGYEPLLHSAECHHAAHHLPGTQSGAMPTLGVPLPAGAVSVHPATSTVAGTRTAQTQMLGGSFERHSYLHPNDAASLVNRSSWSATNLVAGPMAGPVSATTSTSTAVPNVAGQASGGGGGGVAAGGNGQIGAENDNRQLLALFVPRAGSLDA